MMYQGFMPFWPIPMSLDPTTPISSDNKRGCEYKEDERKERDQTEDDDLAVKGREERPGFVHAKGVRSSGLAVRSGEGDSQTVDLFLTRRKHNEVQTDPFILQVGHNYSGFL